MDRLVEWMAPRAWGDALLKGLAFLAMVNALNWVLTVLVRGAAYGIGPDLLNTTGVALPFTALTLATLAHQRRLQHRLAVLATTDMLTGLPNRRAFLARTRIAVRDGRAGAILLLDADHFKRVNDRYGHGVGDACLRAVADHLRAALAPGDIVGRVGGEEFSVFRPGATREGAALLGERLCRAVAVEAEGLEPGLSLTLSAGAALTEADAPLDRLMARADRALYRAKAAGRARVVVWPDGEAEAASAAPGAPGPGAAPGPAAPRSLAPRRRAV